MLLRPERLELPTLWFRSRSIYFVPILPEERLIEWIQQVGQIPAKPLSPSFVVIYHGIAVVFRALREIFEALTVAIALCLLFAIARRRRRASFANVALFVATLIVGLVHW
jgi:hypothetical protein